MRVRNLVSALCLLLALVPGMASADALPNGAWHSQSADADLPVVNVTVNGQAVSSDVPAVILDGRTLLPVRAVAQALGASVSWDATTYTAAVTTAPAGVSVPVTASDSGGVRIMATCSIAGTSLPCVVDTGWGGFGGITAPLATQLGIRATSTVSLEGATGPVSEQQACATIGLGGVSVKGLFVFDDYPVPLIGLGYLEAVASGFSVDFTKGRLTLIGVKTAPAAGC